MVEAAVCLNVAVDHRIRNLFSPVTYAKSSEFSISYALKLSEIAAYVRKNVRRLSFEEMRVTSELAHRSGSGGIMILLQQPASNHPFHLGVDATIHSSASLNALDESFLAASCGTLSLLSVAMLDSLPYVRASDILAKDVKRRIRSLVRDALVAKRPDVTLCAWQDRYGTEPLDDLRSIGVGQTYDPISIHMEEREEMIRINAFHPSYAVNYRPDVSILRQLLLLEVTQTCRQYSHSWNESEWMKVLRQDCASSAEQYARMLSGFQDWRY